LSNEIEAFAKRYFTAILSITYDKLFKKLRRFTILIDKASSKFLYFSFCSVKEKYRPPDKTLRQTRLSLLNKY